MSYDDTSFYGDLYCEEFDEANNFMNPPSPTGYYFYKTCGYVLDDIQEWVSKFLRDYDILSSDGRSLDLFWGISYNMPRPTLPISERKLTDKEYRVYLYLRNCQLLTVRDITICLGKCFNKESEVINVSKVSNYLQVSDHLHYTPKTTETSNIAKRDDDSTKHFVTNFEEDKDTEVIESGLSEVSEVQEYIMIPFDNWDPEFLEFLQPYLSVKGTLVIKQEEG